MAQTCLVNVYYKTPPHERTTLPHGLVLMRNTYSLSCLSEEAEAFRGAAGEASSAAARLLLQAALHLLEALLARALLDLLALRPVGADLLEVVIFRHDRHVVDRSGGGRRWYRTRREHRRRRDERPRWRGWWLDGLHLEEHLGVYDGLGEGHFRCSHSRINA